MKDHETLQRYVSNFRRHLAHSLKPGVGVACIVYPADSGGAAIEIVLGNVENRDSFEPSRPTINAVVHAIMPKPPDALAGFGDMQFGGTNIFMHPDRIVLVKAEDDDTSWSDQGAKQDVERILGPRRPRP